MARGTRIHRKVEPALWTDGDFRALSKPKPSARYLWLWLLTSERTRIIPGVIVARPAVAADDLEWTTAAWRKCMKEITDSGMAEMDEATGLIVLSKALLIRGTPRSTSKPNSPNQMAPWFAAWSELPDCGLKQSLLSTIQSFVTQCGEEFSNAFARAMGTPCRTLDGRRVGRSTDAVQDGVGDGVATQDQKQEQKQDIGEKSGRPDAPPLVLIPDPEQEPERERMEPAVALTSACCEVLNRELGSNFKPTTIEPLDHARRLVKRKITASDVLAVTADRVRAWRHDVKMHEYLTPSTILRPSKFVTYLDNLRARPSHSVQVPQSGGEIVIPRGVRTQRVNGKLFRFDENDCLIPFEEQPS